MERQDQYKKNRRRAILQLFLLIGIIVIANVLLSGFFFRMDLTEEKRFSLSTPTKHLLEEQQDILFVRVYLGGDLTPNLKRLQQSTTEMLDQFKNYAGDNLQYDVFDPFSIPNEENQTEFIKQLEEKGILSVQFFESATDEASVKYVFPFASISYKDVEIAFPLIDRGTMPLPLNPDSDPSVSISLLEYNFTKAIRQITDDNKPYVAFVSGHGELNRFELNDIAGSLNELYNVTQIELEDDSTFEIPRECKALVIAKPLISFSMEGKYIIDQFIMQGGNVMWLIDPVIADFDSLYTGKGQFMAIDRELNITDMLLQYGARINSNIVQDKQCSHINVPVSNGENFVMRPWPYNPILNNFNPNHPISKNVDAIEGKFVSTVDTISVPGIKKTILVSTSGLSRYISAPARVNFNIVDNKFAPTDAQYNKPNTPVAVLLEGQFPSAFKSLKPTANRLHQLGFGYQNAPYMEKGVGSKQIMIGDGDLIKNYVDEEGKPDMLGINYIERYIYGNKDFAMNCIEYLCDQDGLIETRAKEVKLRPLDDQKVGDNRIQWQLLNMIAPLLVLYIFSGIYFFIRNRKYAA
ncbi:MAG: gliding motility-associated ABC transporter substrate-binding protein GldG [Bacteroidetes bacterium]|nr:gliding motility-associated ABC transporter substrate-binding protein GldG [Bacteroidota bacterium]MBK8345655.1 gliding motility-associated ABC transporter substrate-binding protein GldG [Bacteroidota bacterium]